MNVSPSYAFNSRSTQRAINVFAFLLAFPGFELFGNSLYFYVFLWILFKTYNRTGKFLKWSNFTWLLLLSWLLGIISTISHPPMTSNSFSMSNSIVMITRFGYWFAIAAYFSSWSSKINFFNLAKWVTLGYFIQTLGFYFVQVNFGFLGFSFSSALTRNSYVFNSILFSGFILYYLNSRYGNKMFWPTAIFVVLNLMFTNGRAGAAVGVIILFLYYTIKHPSIHKIFKLIIPLLIFTLFLGSNIKESIYSFGSIVAPYIEPISPRFSNFIIGVEEGDLDFDRSWLERELMLAKTSEIISEYPLLGVGYGNFSSYESRLSAYWNTRYSRLQGEPLEYYNARSAHNSYANHLGETGIVGFLILLALITPSFIRFLTLYWRGRLSYMDYKYYIVLGLIGGLIHGYTISAFTGANFWFILGVGHGLMELRRI